MVHRPTPPYAIPTPSFRFPQLATLVGSAPIGGSREALMGAFVVARLTASASGADRLPAAARQTRAAAAQTWVSSLSLPQSARSVLLRAISASADDDSKALREAVDQVASELGITGAAARELAGAVSDD